MMIPIIGMIIPALIIVFALERAYRIRKLEHEAKLAAIEKGYDVPVKPTKRPSSHYPFAWPLVMLCFGSALILIYVLNGAMDPEALGFGLIIFFVGAGLFASRFIGVKKQEEEEEPLSQTPAAWSAPEPVSVPTTPSESSDTGHSTGA
ncbi:MAG TPA: hypothetical protein ENH10_08955 [Bacteroidetes bacterium]|nr:hypothetical protein [Bacteroidota bacterium]HEX05263.1 hypothetical protein [Bacteroidota bacterium]